MCNRCWGAIPERQDLLISATQIDFAKALILIAFYHDIPQLIFIS